MGKVVGDVPLGEDLPHRWRRDESGVDWRQWQIWY